MKHKVTVAGEGSGISVTTMHDSGNPFDRTFASSELFGSSGVNFAVVDGYSTIEASLRGRGQFIQPGMYIRQWYVISFTCIACIFNYFWGYYVM